MRVVIADDSALLREGIARILQGAGWHVVGLCADAVTLQAMIIEHQPDLAVIDVRMPPTYRAEGLEAAARIRSDHPDTSVMLLSQHIETAYLADLLAASSRNLGYLLKDRVSDVDDFLEALQRVSAGGTAIDPDIISRLMAKHRSADQLAALSERERDVLARIAEGHTNAAIAQRLVLSERTVEAHIRNIFTRLDINHSTDAHRRVLAVVAYLRGA